MIIQQSWLPLKTKFEALAGAAESLRSIVLLPGDLLQSSNTDLQMAKASLSLYVLLTSIVAVALRYYALWHNSAQVEPGPLRTGLEAKEDAYHEPLKILSYDPFIAYLPDFVSLAERNYLINMS